MKYTLSFQVRRRFTQLRRRPWWAIFASDRLEVVERWEKQVFGGLTKKQADALIEASHSGFNDEMGQLMLRLMSMDGMVAGVDLRADPHSGGVVYVRHGDVVSIGVP